MAIAGPTLQAKLSLDKSGFDKNIKSSKSSLISMGKLVAGTAFAGAIAAGVTDSIKKFAEFENKMKTVQTLLDGDAKSAVEGFSKEIIDMTTRIPVKANDLADSLFDVISAGVDAGDSIAFLEEAAKLAVSGATDTKTAVDGMTSAYNAFTKEGLTANQIADKFFAAQKKGKTTIAELSTTIGRVAPTASAMNMSLDETLGIIASLTTKGIATSESVTGLKAVISNIIKPSKEAADEAARLGIAFDEQTLKSDGLIPVLRSLKDRVDSGDTSFTKMFGSVEALNTVLALADDNFVNAKEGIDAVANSAGLSTEKFEEQKESLENQFILIGNNVDALKLKLGTILAPAIVWTTDLLLKMFNGDTYQGLFRALEITGVQLGEMFGELKLWLADVGGSVADWADSIAIKNEQTTSLFKLAWQKVKGVFTDTSAEQIQIQEETDAKILEINNRGAQRTIDLEKQRSELHDETQKKILAIEQKYTVDSGDESDARKTKQTKNLGDTATAAKDAKTGATNSELAAEKDLTKEANIESDARKTKQTDNLTAIKNTAKKTKLTDADSESKIEKELTIDSDTELYNRKTNANTIYDDIKKIAKNKLISDTDSIDNSEKDLTKNSQSELSKRGMNTYSGYRTISSTAYYQLGLIQDAEEELTDGTLRELTDRRGWAINAYSSIKDAAKSQLTGTQNSIKSTEEELSEAFQNELGDRKKDFEDHISDMTNLGYSFGTNFNSALDSLIDEAFGAEGTFTQSVSNALAGIVGADTAGFVGGLFGGVITTGIGAILTGIFGSEPTKTVAEYAEDAFDTMVRNTNNALSDIGREKNLYELVIDVLEEMKAQGKTTIGSELNDFFRTTELIPQSQPGFTIDAIMSAMLQQIRSLESSEVDVVNQEIELKQNQIANLRERKTQVNEIFPEARQEQERLAFLSDLDMQIAAANSALEQYRLENQGAPLEAMLDILRLNERINSIGMATGGSFVVNEPTRLAPGIVAGEAGPEQVTVNPIGRGGSGMNGNITININGSDQSPASIANSVKYVLDDPFFVSSMGERIQI